MNKVLPALLPTLAFAIAPAIAHAEPLQLAQNGKPNATIVLQKDAPKIMQIAAADLQKYIQKISGVELPLKTDGKDAPGITLNIGKTDSAKNGDLPDAKLNPETYAIRLRGDDVYFAANYPTPTAFAVYSFLQNNLGVRWFAPGEDWEWVPRSTPGALKVDAKSVVKTPDFSPRVWSSHGWTPDWVAWQQRNKTIASERLVRRNFQNNMYRVFPPSKYAKTHPEYYPLVNGKRWIPDSDDYRYWWPCIGNPDVQRITVEYIRQWFKDHPDQDSFSLGMDDIAYMCSDDLCRAMDAHPDDYEKRKFSDRFYKFINIIAKEVKKTNPDKYIGTLVYNIARELPEDVMKMEDNVFGFITQNVATWHNPEIKKADITLTREWAKRMKHLSRYDYFGMGTFAPRIYPHAIDEAIKLDHSLGFDGMYVEMYTFLPHTAPMIWTFAQQQWDASQNVDTLLNEFYAKMYPSTTQLMKSYFDLMEKSWNTAREGHVGWVHRNIIGQATSISAEDARRGLEILDKAYAQAKTPIEKRRIDVSRGGLKYASYAILEYDLARRIAALPINSKADAEQGLAMLREFAGLVKDRDPYWLAARERKDLLGENLRGLYNMKLSNGESYLQTNTAQLDSPAIPGAIRIAEWYRRNQPQEASRVVSDLLARFPQSAIADTMTAWNWIAENKPASLLKNGDFESRAANTKPAAQADWKTEGAPAGWSTWSSLGSGKFTTSSGFENGGNGVHILAPPTDNAVVLQNADVTPGKKYMGQVWVKVDNQLAAASVTLTLRLRAKGGWYTGDKTTFTTSASSTDNWQPLMIATTIPEGVTGLAFMLGVRSTSATFDNAVLYEIG
jgi:hypothetical protein